MAISALTSADVWPIAATVRIDFTQVDASTAPAYATDGLEVLTNQGPAVYAKVGSGGCSAGDYCAMSQVVATRVVTMTKEDTTTSGAAPRKGGIALATLTVGQYGWFLRGPFNRVPVNVANSVSSLANVTTTGTAGQLGAGGDAIPGLYVIEASGASGLTAASAVQPLGTNN